MTTRHIDQLINATAAPFHLAFVPSWTGLDTEPHAACHEFARTNGSLECGHDDLADSHHGTPGLADGSALQAAAA